MTTPVVIARYTGYQLGIAQAPEPHTTANPDKQRRHAGLVVAAAKAIR